MPLRGTFSTWIDPAVCVGARNTQGVVVAINPHYLDDAESAEEAERRCTRLVRDMALRLGVGADALITPRFYPSPRVVWSATHPARTLAAG